VKVVVDVPVDVVKEVKESLERKVGEKKLAKVIAQNIIDRYFSLDYIDVEEIEMELEVE
jgi:hypothetical protein